MVSVIYNHKYQLQFKTRWLTAKILFQLYYMQLIFSTLLPKILIQIQKSTARWHSSRRALFDFLFSVPLNNRFFFYFGYDIAEQLNSLVIIQLGEILGTVYLRLEVFNLADMLEHIFGIALFLSLFLKFLLAAELERTILSLTASSPIRKNASKKLSQLISAAELPFQTCRSCTYAQVWTTLFLCQ